MQKKKIIKFEEIDGKTVRGLMLKEPKVKRVFAYIEEIRLDSKPLTIRELLFQRIPDDFSDCLEFIGDVEELEDLYPSELMQIWEAAKELVPFLSHLETLMKSLMNLSPQQIMQVLQSS